MHANLVTGLRLILLLSFLGVRVVGTTYAAAYIPQDGRQVLERLPVKNDPAQKQLRELRAQLQSDPNNLSIAVDLSKRYIAMSRAEADPRYLGYAQAALKQWWAQPNPPPELRLVRATILQSTHRFSEALADLDAVLKLNDRNAQAWLTRATILQVQGEYQQAGQSCARLHRMTSYLIATTCLANVANLNGDARRSYQSLQAALSRDQDAPLLIQVWVLTLLGEMADRQGLSAETESYFRRALAIDRTDSYLLGAWSDHLLDRGKYDDVIALLKTHTKVDGLLLRYAIALDRRQSASAPEMIKLLRDRFAAAMLRGDTVHQREQSRFELQLMRNPQRALQLAQLNWQIQREPADARVLLEAAAAARDPAAARPVLDWMKSTKLEDAVLAPLKNQLGGNT